MLDGLVLHSRIWPNAIATDQRILAFAAREAADEFLEKLLVEEKEKRPANDCVHHLPVKTEQLR